MFATNAKVSVLHIEMFAMASAQPQSKLSNAGPSILFLSEKRAKTMTNAIEQTKREMYRAISIIRETPYHGSGARYFSVPEYVLDNFEGHLEAHLESMRQDRAAVAEERDTMRNQLQALQMASSTAAEVIRGLRRELDEVREGVAAADLSRMPETPPASAWTPTRWDSLSPASVPTRSRSTPSSACTGMTGRRMLLAE